MPRSAAPFLAETVSEFIPATPASVISGTATAERATAGNYGMSLGNSATVEMQFPLPGLGQTPAEAFPPYEQYNNPIAITPNQNYLTVYYSVASAALSSISLGIFATSFGASGATVTTLLAQATNGLQTAIGTYAVQIPLNSLPKVPVPNSLVVVELDIATPSGGTAIVNGVQLS